MNARISLVRLAATVAATVVLGAVAYAAATGPDTPTSPDDPTPPASAGSSLTGSVTDTSGAPVAGATVVPAPRAGTQPVPDMAVLTDAEGHFRWGLAPGTYDVTALAGARTSDPVAVTVPASGTATITLVLPAN